MRGSVITGVRWKDGTPFDANVAPTLVPLREKLVGMVGRPVNIQGTRDWFQHFRGDVLGQPYLRLFGTLPESET